MAVEHSHVLRDGAPKPAESERYFLEKLRFYTDARDLALDLRDAHPAIVVVDARSHHQYREAHIPDARCLPISALDLDTMRELDKTKTYVVYGDDPWCQQSTKVAHRLAQHGLIVKELLGGFEYWRRANHPLAHGTKEEDSV